MEDDEMLVFSEPSIDNLAAATRQSINSRVQEE